MTKLYELAILELSRSKRHQADPGHVAQILGHCSPQVIRDLSQHNSQIGRIARSMPPGRTFARMNAFHCAIRIWNSDDPLGRDLRRKYNGNFLRFAKAPGD